MAHFGLLFVLLNLYNSIAYGYNVKNRDSRSTGCNVPEPVDGYDLLEQFRDKGPFYDGDTVEYRCARGYYLSSLNSYKRTCEGNRWTELEFDCRETTCPYIETPKNARRLDSNYLPGQTTTIVCKEGYTRRGQGTLMCGSDGTWSPTFLPECDPVPCETKWGVSGGRIVYDDGYGPRNKYGAVIHYRCDRGYRLVGPKTRTCQANGEWSGTETACEEPKCPVIDVYPDGTVSYHGDRKVATWAVFECQRGFDFYPEQSDDFATTTCSGDETWAAYPLCYKTHELKLSDTMAGNCVGKLKHRQSCEVLCERGYELKRGASYVDKIRLTIRNSKGDLNEDFDSLSCVPERCSVDTAGKSFYYTDINGDDISNDKVQHDHRLQVHCNSGHEFRPETRQNEVKCSLGQIGSLPSICRPKRCDLKDSKWKQYNFYSRMGRSEFKKQFAESGTTLLIQCHARHEFMPRDRRTNSITVNCFRGELNGNFKDCFPKQCELNSTIVYRTNSDIVEGYIDNGTVVTLECRSGLSLKPELDSGAKQTCFFGDLTGNKYSCIPDPCESPSIFNGTLQSGTEAKEYGPGDTITHSETVSVKCNSGFTAESPDVEIKCSYGQLKPSDLPKCVPSPCSSPIISNSNLRKRLWDINHGERVTVKCDDGYTVDTSDVNLACSFGKLSPDRLPVCNPDPCVSPQINHGTLKSTTHTKRYRKGKSVPHDELVKVICKKGYRTDSFSNDIKCSLGRFIPDILPGCVQKRCDGIKKTEGMSATLDGENYNFNEEVEQGSKLEMMCSKGYILMADGIISNSGAMECLRKTAEWNVTYSCEPTCEVPVINNGEFELVLKTDVITVGKYSFSVTCHDGYKQISGDVNVQRECKNGKWKKEDSQYCVLIEDTPPSTDDNEVDSAENNNSITTTTEPSNKPVDNVDENSDNAHIEESDSESETNENGKPPNTNDDVNKNGQDNTSHDIDSNKDTETHVNNNDDHGQPGRTDTADPNKDIGTTTHGVNQESAEGTTSHPSDNEVKSDDYSDYDDEADEEPETCLIEKSNRYEYYDIDGIDLLSPNEKVKNGDTIVVHCKAENDYMIPVDVTTTCKQGTFTSFSLTCEEVKTETITKPKECKVIENGEIVDNGYSVTCNDGYELESAALYSRYSCKCDPLDKLNPFKCFETRPKCKEVGCELPYFITERMHVQNTRTKQKLYPDDRNVRHATMVTVECEQRGKTVYEPKGRNFKCDRGNWTVMNKDWGFNNNGMFPKCREANCECQFGSKCVRDETCECVRFSTGKQCETPICPRSCDNGGTCVAPQQCACVNGFSGDRCQIAGCVPPEGLVAVADVYTDRAVLDIQDYHCAGDGLPYPKEKITCYKGTWSANVQCLQEITYRIEIKTAPTWWHGTNDEVYIRLKGSLRDTGTIYFSDHNFKGDATDFLTIHSIDVGQLHSIDLGVRKRGMWSDDWNPAYVQIIVDKHQAVYYFKHDKSAISDSFVNLPAELRCLPPLGMSAWSSSDVYTPASLFACKGDYITKDNSICANGKWSPPNPVCIKGKSYRVRIQPNSRHAQENEYVLKIKGVNGRVLPEQHFSIYRGRVISEQTIKLDDIGEIDSIEVSGISWLPDFISITSEGDNEYYIFRPSTDTVIRDQTFTLYPKACTFIVKTHGTNLTGIHREQIDVDYTDACRVRCLETLWCRSYKYIKGKIGETIRCYLIDGQTVRDGTHKPHIGHFYRKCD